MTEPKPLVAWHGIPELREQTLELLREDLAHDRYAQGFYLRLEGPAALAFRGCHLGCLVAADMRIQSAAAFNNDVIEGIDIYGDWHNEVEIRFGIPSEIAQWWDTIFELLSPTAAPEFAVTSVESVQVGADLTGVLYAVFDSVIDDPTHGLMRLIQEPAATAFAIEAVQRGRTRRDRALRCGDAEHDAFASRMRAVGQELRIGGDSGYLQAMALSILRGFAWDGVFGLDDVITIRSDHFAAGIPDGWRADLEWVTGLLLEHTRNAPMAVPAAV